jgi:tetratricopeptide (TPR) repeat protein
MRIYKGFWVAGVLATALGCGGGNTKGPDTAGGGGKVLPPEHKVSPEAEKEFSAAVDELTTHDKNADWSDAACSAVADHFESARKLEGKPFPEASYDAGLAYQRCNNDKEARSHFEAALQANSAFHYARAQIALYQFKADGNLDSAISSLEQAVQDAKFNDVPALVDLSMFQMQRDSDSVGATCKTDFNGQDAALKDFECAKTNLQRALAIDDSYMPAFNQLALYYFTRAKKAAGKATKSKRQIMTNASMTKRADVQQLELASLVTSQAIRKNAKYAPIHNTAGLILNELGQVNGAVNEFAQSVALDPNFFEALMNLAAVNLSFRGFDKAEAAYKKALAIKPNDYDAHLGFALALRGQINDTNYDAQVAAVQSELDACKKLSPDRPDAYFNEGILTEEFKSKAGGDKQKTIASLTSAIAIYKDFTAKASGKDEYAGAVKKAGERSQDCQDKINFLNTPDAPPPPPPPASSVGTPGGADSAAPATSAAPAPSASAP